MYWYAQNSSATCKGKRAKSKCFGMPKLAFSLVYMYKFAGKIKISNMQIPRLQKFAYLELVKVIQIQFLKVLKHSLEKA